MLGWTGPVSFAGFSSPCSQLSSSLAPASLLTVHQPQARANKQRQGKRKKKWFNIF